MGVRLPVHEIEEGLKSAMRTDEGARVLLKAPTGSGKSTAVPGMLADLELGGRILVIEPRRMAARMLARWVAKLRGTRVGGEVGHAVRFDTQYGRDTKIIYLTDGVFQRWLQDDPELRGVSAVVFDEFHERRLAVDVALGRCLDLQEGPRADLRLLVMSATLETAGLAEFLEPVIRLEAGGRTFPVEIHYRGAATAATRGGNRRGGPVREIPVWDRVAKACQEALDDAECGDILCFLPGMYEIRRTVELLSQVAWARGCAVLPLHGGLKPEAQEEAVGPNPRRKIIVSTNVAETSLTIDGVRTVIDAGLARVASFDPRRGIATLLVQKISRAAAEQRAGRAGRTAPGRCFRLWSEVDHGRRDAFEIPEVHRVDLAEAALLLMASGVEDVGGFRWLESPQPEGLAKAMSLLHDLGATDVEGRLTDEGHAMAALPLEPRFARLMLAGVEEGCVAEMAFVSAAVQGEGVWFGKKSGMDDFVMAEDYSDFQAEWRGFESAVAMRFDPQRVSQIGVSGRGCREIQQSFERLKRLAQQRGWPWEGIDFEGRQAAVSRAMLAGFSDQLGVQRAGSTLACRLVGKRKGRLDEKSAARQAVAFVAAEITEVQGKELVVHLRRATKVDLESLRSLFPEDLNEGEGAVWDETRRRVVARQERRFRDLVLESKDSDQGADLDAAAGLLAERVISGELVLKRWDDAVEQWCARLAGLSAWMPELELPGWSEEDREMAVAQICHGAVSYKEIKDAPVWPVLKDWLSAAQRAALDAYAPERIKLPTGREAKVRYGFGKEPVIGLMVRDLFGVWQTPTIAGGKVLVLVEVQAPNRRAWQVTKDLESFWESGYRQMRKDLAGRYPKHPWPEDPKAG
ncbi:ATP-dependent helicase HrpB [Haloferula rosea]|nr:ATP-dependent helicase HrpB [Haloferula rosea]